MISVKLLSDHEQTEKRMSLSVRNINENEGGNREWEKAV